MATVGAAESDSQCAALVQSLNKVTACHHHLAVSLGGSADCARLREELRCTRERAHGVADATRVALTLLLRDKAVVGDRRAELERLWVSFSCCLELLEGDMRRALEISGQFPVGAARVRTGMSGTTVAIASRALSAKDVRSAAAAAAAAAGGGLEDTQALEKDVQELGTMLNEMENKVNVPRWSVVAAREPGAELHSTASGSSVAMLTEEGARGEPCCDPGRRLVAAFCGGALLLALVLAAAVVMFA
ncbi:regulator of G-protein signaling 9-binding protein [Petromyzon marinus]|uniref:regulator of G-protein signaling 9-binding protein n=1 Tax=Petromyzon marinus TaxID=7757 RepID=UPI003F711E94